jgi:hypothetical protein
VVTAKEGIRVGSEENENKARRTPGRGVAFHTTNILSVST